MDFTLIDENVTESDDVLEGCDCLGLCMAEAGCRCLLYQRDNYLSGTLRNAFDSIIPIVECHDECKCPPSCPNKLVGNGTKKKLDPFYDPKKGYGLKATDSINAKEFVVEYKGEIIMEEQARKRTLQYKKHGHEHNYIYTINEHLVGMIEDRVQKTFIDATHFGGLARFINHSCSPNLCPVIVRYGGTSPKLALFAKKFIKQGDELCYDYGSFPDPVNGGKKCYCAASNCRGFLPSGSYEGF